MEKMCHAPAICYQVKDRGFLDEGKWADVIVVDPEEEFTVSKDNIHYKCGWSPFEGHSFRGKIDATIVSGHLAWLYDQFFEEKKGERLEFERD